MKASDTNLNTCAHHDSIIMSWFHHRYGFGAAPIPLPEPSDSGYVEIETTATTIASLLLFANILNIAKPMKLFGVLVSFENEVPYLLMLPPPEVFILEINHCFMYF
jgi:hypothetical protein